jgi:hypothetical protein
MVSVAQLPAEQLGVLLEIDAVDRRVGRKPGPLDNDEVEPVAKAHTLARPRRATSGDTPVDEHDTFHKRYPREVTKFGEIAMITVFPLLQTRIARLVCSRAMEPSPRPTFSPAGAGAMLATTTTVSIGVGSLIGFAAGNWGFGALGGAVVGVPAGAYAVYRRYRGYFT